MSDSTDHWGGLVHLIAALRPRPCYESKSFAPPEPLAPTAGIDACENAAATLALGISTIGRMMTRRDDINPLGHKEVENLGDLLASLGETLHELNQLEQTLRDQITLEGNRA